MPAQQKSKKKIHLALPADVYAILRALMRSGWEAYVVGGCVRDSLMGRVPQDWDICTAATPAQIKACFSKEQVLDTGIAHGTVTLMRGERAYEITTFRIESGYSDKRRPDKVEFVSDLRADLARRDFTVNAMAYAPGVGLMDPFGGRRDIKRRVLRCVGRPSRRFEEDALRVLRLTRFAAVLDFSVYPSTARAAVRAASGLTQVAAERCTAEFCALLQGKGAPRVLHRMQKIYKALLPALQQPKAARAWQQAATALAFVPRASEDYDVQAVRLALMAHAVDQTLLHTLRLPHALCKRVALLAQAQKVLPAPAAPAVRGALAKMGPEGLLGALAIQTAWERAGRAPRRAVLRGVAAVRIVCRRVLAQRQCYTRAALAVNGADLCALGMQEGRAVGAVLQSVLDAVIRGDLPNDRAVLIDVLREQISKGNAELFASAVDFLA